MCKYVYNKLFDNKRYAFDKQKLLLNKRDYTTNLTANVMYLKLDKLNALYNLELKNAHTTENNLNRYR